MSTKELLLNEIEHCPEPFLNEVLDFMNFLKTKSIQERLEITDFIKNNMTVGRKYPVRPYIARLF